MAIGVLVSLGLAKVAAVVTLAKIAKRKKQSQNPKGRREKQIRKSGEKSR
jgi:hypothetical protein